MPSIYRMMRILTFFANRVRDIRQFIADVESRVSFEVKDEEKFYIEFRDGKVFVRKGAIERPDAVIKGDKKIFMAIVSGRLSQEEAFNRRLIETSGSMPDAMRVRYLINTTLEKSKLLKLLQRFT